MTTTTAHTDQIIEALPVGSEWYVHHERFGVMQRRPRWRRVKEHSPGQITLSSEDGERWFPLVHGVVFACREDGGVEILAPTGDMAVFVPVGVCRG